MKMKFEISKHFYFYNKEVSPFATWGRLFPEINLSIEQHQLFKEKFSDLGVIKNGTGCRKALQPKQKPVTLKSKI